ncbi:MAG: redox-sensing transcriptional repressor Rex [Acidimicrobiales bacterium]
MATAMNRKRDGTVPRPTVNRLPLYRRALQVLVERGNRHASSSELAEVVGVNPATLRRDLSLLGSYGTRGSGYEVAVLLGEVDKALAIDRDWPVAIVGVGNLGRALTRSEGFGSRGFRVAALLDVDPKVVGATIGGVKVEHLEEIDLACARERVAIGVITTPASVAQSVCDRLVRAGVHSILNFAPAVLSVPPAVVVRQVDLALELQVLAFYRSRRGRQHVASRSRQST